MQRGCTFCDYLFDHTRLIRFGDTWACDDCAGPRGDVKGAKALVTRDKSLGRHKAHGQRDNFVPGDILQPPTDTKGHLDPEKFAKWLESVKRDPMRKIQLEVDSRRPQTGISKPRLSIQSNTLNREPMLNGIKSLESAARFGQLESKETKVPVSGVYKTLRVKPASSKIAQGNWSAQTWRLLTCKFRSGYVIENHKGEHSAQVFPEWGSAKRAIEAAGYQLVEY